MRKLNGGLWLGPSRYLRQWLDGHDLAFDTINGEFMLNRSFIFALGLTGRFFEILIVEKRVVMMLKTDFI